VAEHLQESTSKHTDLPEDLNATTATMLEGRIGLNFTETTARRVRAEVAISPVLRQATGVVHGGAYCSIAETVASWGVLLSLGTVSNGLESADGPADGDETVLIHVRTGSGDVAVRRSTADSASRA
jgi:acyl-coenzyme A thioesterase PaaI-like protein